MAQIKPSLAKGTRDFSPLEMERRNYIFDTFKSIFKKYGYQEIQTPSFENLQTLTGKYGEEGDKLIFKILNSGDFKNKVDLNTYQSLPSQALASLFSEKALRYDLTVPFARYVVMHQPELTLPFKRYQIQPVWRADRPQRGRYREFYQCDVDVVGSESLINEAEFVVLYDEALSKLRLNNFTIKLNNRKLLAGIAELIGKPELLIDMTVAIDKLDKIGFSGVEQELLQKGFSSNDIDLLNPIIHLSGNNQEKIQTLKSVLSNIPMGIKGLEEIEQVLTYVEQLHPSSLQHLEVDITLARGLNYYTGSIFEVKTNEVAMGSIGGGGRYDDLTGMFGWKGLTGVGVSFGADRIYDVLLELQLFPENTQQGTQVLITNFDSSLEKSALSILQEIRNNQISAELYPSPSKLKKQLAYADGKHIPIVLLMGEEEVNNHRITIKIMETGFQETMPKAALLDHLKTLL